MPGRGRRGGPGPRAVPVVLTAGGLLLMTTGVVDAAITRVFHGMAPGTPLIDDGAMTTRILWACLPILISAGLAGWAGGRPWVVAALAAPAVLVGLPALAGEVPANAVPLLGFPPAAALALAGVVAVVTAPRRP